MSRYAITFARSARKELEVLEAPLVVRVVARIEALAADPRPQGCRKIKGAKNLWRVRVGDYRVIYSIDDRMSIVDVVAVRHRSEAYR